MPPLLHDKIANASKNFNFRTDTFKFIYSLFPAPYFVPQLPESSLIIHLLLLAGGAFVTDIQLMQRTTAADSKK